MLMKIVVIIILLAGVRLMYGSLPKAVNPPEIPADANWWNGLSEEWKTIFRINQAFQKQQVDIFKLQQQYINRMNAAGEAAITEMNCSLYKLSGENRFGLGYTDLYARALRKNQVVDTGSIDLETLASLETVYMVNGPADLTPLKKLPHLTVLIINYCGIDVSVPVSRDVLDLEPLRQLKELRVIHCSSPALYSLAPLKDLPNLEEIRCENSNVTSLAPLKKLVNLKRLTIGAKINNASIISSFENLEALTMETVKLMPDFGKLKKLERLCIVESEMAIVDPRFRIRDINFISRLTNLSYADLGHTSYRGTLEPLSALQHLKAITLPPVNQENMLQFKSNHTNCVIINSFQYEK